jgi:hypothetical protein
MFMYGPIGSIVGNDVCIETPSCMKNQFFTPSSLRLPFQLAAQHHRLIFGGFDVVRHIDEIRLDTDAPHTITPSGYFVNWFVAVSFHWPDLSHTHAVWPETEAAFVAEDDVQLLARPLSLVHLRQLSRT